MDNQNFQVTNNYENNSIMDPQGFQTSANDATSTNPSITTKPPVSKTSTSKILLITTVALSILVIISLILGIVNLAQINNINSILTESGIIAEDADDIEDETPDTISCNLPSTPQNIEYFYSYYNNGDSSFFIDSSNHISIYTNRVNESGQTVEANSNITIDTSDMIQSIFDNGINAFSDYTISTTEEEENNTETYNWRAQIDMTDSSSCEAKGNDNPPEWLADIITKINLLASKE